MKGTSAIETAPADNGSADHAKGARYPFGVRFSLRSRRRRLHSLTFVALALVNGACSHKVDPEAAYRPTESVLEAIAVLRLHIDDDTYRYPAARDFNGKNIFLASLTRLERLEQIHEEKLSSGYLLAPTLFAKGRALERLGEHELAALHYQRVASFDSVLRRPAEESQEISELLSISRRAAPTLNATPERAIAIFESRSHPLDQRLPKTEGSHHWFVIQEEIERIDEARARYFGLRAQLEPELSKVSLAQFQRLLRRHPESKNHNRHLLDLADLYSGLARSYVERFPPTSLDYDPATFDEQVFGATRLYETVSNQDGSIEKIEAARKLEAFLAFVLRIQNEKLPRS